MNRHRIRNISLIGLLVLAVGFDTAIREMITRRRLSLPDLETI